MIITDLQTQIVQRLQASAEFAGPPRVEILTERIADWINKLTNAVNIDTGLAVLVGIPRVSRSGGSGLLAVEAAVSIQIFENVTLNQHDTGTRIACADAALNTIGVLHGWAPEGAWDALLFREFKIADATAEHQLVYEAVYRTGVTLQITTP